VKSRIHCRRRRSILAAWRDHPGPEGHQALGAAGDLRGGADKRQPHADYQPGEAALDNADLRRAMSLTLDRKAFIDIIAEGQGDIGGTMLPASEGV